MRTDPRLRRQPEPEPPDPLEPSGEEAAPGPSPMARAATIVFFLALGLVGWFLVARPDGSADDGTVADDRPSAESDATSLTAGTYRLPGLTTPVSVTVPAGWVAGDSIWGPASQGVAAVTTGRPGAEISIALLDLDVLRPVDPVTEAALDRPGDPAWFGRALPAYRAQVQPRVRDRIVGRRLDWTPPPMLAWLLTFTDRGAISIADDIVYDGMAGDLVTFAFPGPRREIFRSPQGGITLKPGITYTFWLPRPGPGVPPVVLGVARQLGAVPGTAEWDVVRTIGFGG